ncbi:AAA domain-containing protein [Microbacterium testaceum StLB037]|uniref:Nuclease SbcCD subunit C n=1 Tax=Microbacterium testaceum (strain StLB037) TaxID=979556 RepID=A0A1H0Q9S3_MICTS|nr:AAA domain-containing protein [Microbacterium testaceum StLB037]
MTRYFLTRVSVEGFRGVNNEGAPLTLDFKTDRVNSVFAPNGSGKSSFYEALEYAFRGRVGRLGEMQSAENPDNYVANLFHSRRHSTIVVTLVPDDGGSSIEIKIERDAGGVRRVSSTDTSSPDSLLASMNEDFALLDYAAFNRFIEDTALDRGRSFSSLLGLSEYGDLLRSLKAVSNSQTFRTDFKTPELEANQASLREQAERALRDFSTHYASLTSKRVDDVSLAPSWGQDVVQALRGVKLLAPLLTEVEDLDSVDFAVLKRTIFEAENGELRERYTGLLERKSALLASIRSRASVEASQELKMRVRRYDEACAEATEAQLQNLLLAAEDYLQGHTEEESTCPLCERPGADNLGERVTERLSALQQMQHHWASVREEVASGAFIARLSELESRVSPRLDDEGSIASAIRERVQTGSGLNQELIREGETRLQKLENLLAARLADADADLEQMEASLPPSLVQLAEQVAAGEAARSALSRYRDARAALEKVETELRSFDGWKRFVDTAYRSFAAAEADMSQRILDELRLEYQELFKGVMSVGDIVPTLTRSAGSEQLAVELSDFHGASSVSARAVLSESYRNALAISVFLSAAARHGKAPRFVILDDVTSSFDAGHQFKLMEQLRTRLQHDGSNDGLQVILLSHDVTLEKYFDRLDDGRSWHHQKLQGWPPLTPVTAHNQSADRLRTDAERYLQAGQVPEGSGLIRQYLEFVLQQVIRKVQIPVPIDLAVNDHSKMVGACLDAIVDAVTLRQAAGTIVLETQQIADLTGHHVPAIVANWVSHYGTAASASFSPASLLGVLGDIDAIRRCFQYDASGTGDWRFYKSLTRRS